MRDQRARTRDAALQEAFGTVLRRHRLAKGLSQDALGELAKMHRNHVSFLERGLQSPSLVKVFDLAEALQVPPDELVGEVAAEAMQLYQAKE